MESNHINSLANPFAIDPDDGKRISVEDHDLIERKIRLEKRGLGFICPLCVDEDRKENRLILRGYKSEKISTHFSHASGGGSIHSEETIWHYTVKQLISDFVNKSDNWSAELEKPLANTKLANYRRPDITISRGTRKTPIALEIQHSGQSLLEYLNRNEDYRASEMKVQWFYPSHKPNFVPWIEDNEKTGTLALWVRLIQQNTGNPKIMVSFVEVKDAKYLMKYRLASNPRDSHIATPDPHSNWFPLEEFEPSISGIEPIEGTQACRHLNDLKALKPDKYKTGFVVQIKAEDLSGTNKAKNHIDTAVINESEDYNSEAPENDSSSLINSVVQPLKGRVIDMSMLPVSAYEQRDLFSCLDEELDDEW